MRHVFIIRLTLLLSGILSCSAQSELDDSLLYYEHQYFKCSDVVVKQNILIKKTELYIRAGFTGTNVFNEVRRVNTTHLDSTQHYFLWNAALISYLNNENDYARFFLKEYENLKKDSTVNPGLLKILIYKYIDTSVTRATIAKLSENDSLFKGLSCFEDVSNYNKKHLNLYLLASAIVPGTGTALNGEVLKGLLSLALTSASVYGIVKLVEYGLYVNAVLWGTGVGLKFYAGNINLTEKSFYRAESKQKNKLATSCELTLKKLLDKYPLTLKAR